MPFQFAKWFFPVFQGLSFGVLAMTLHEVGHLLAALAVGIRIKNVGFCWKGMYTVREPGPPAKNVLVSLAGPMVNVVLMFTWHWSPTFGLANLCFALFNLLPLKGSDGERILICLRDMQKAAQMAR